MEAGGAAINGYLDIKQGSKSVELLNSEISVILSDEAGRPISVQKISEQDPFNFTLLTNGNYQLMADYPGYYSAIVKAAIPTNSSILNTNIYLSQENNIGINEPDFENDFRIFPNPVTDGLFIKKAASVNYNLNIKIIDLHAQILFETGNTPQNGLEYYIDFSAFDKGLYFVILSDPLSGVTFSKKIIKI